MDFSCHLFAIQNIVFFSFETCHNTTDDCTNAAPPKANIRLYPV